MKICMIGCGGHASTAHGPAQKKYAERHPQTTLAACCDRDAARAAAYREEFGYERCYQDAEEMLAKERPDALCVVVPTFATCQVASPLLRRGLPMLLEKPPGCTSAELETLIAAAEIGKGPHQVAFNRRHMPILLQAQKILAAEMPPESVFQIDYEMIRNDRRDEDFSTTAIHAIDAALFLARSPFRHADLRYRRFDNLGATVVGIQIEAECRSGTQVSLNIQPVAGRNMERVCLHAHKQSLVIEFPVSGPHGPGAELTLWKEDRKAFAIGADDPNTSSMGIYEETEAFFEAIRHGCRPGPSLAECRQPVALMEAVRARKTSIDWALE